MMNHINRQVMCLYARSPGYKNITVNLMSSIQIYKCTCKNTYKPQQMFQCDPFNMIARIYSKLFLLRFTALFPHLSGLFCLHGLISTSYWPYIGGQSP